MDPKPVKLKRTLGMAPAYGAAVGLVVSGTAMFSVGNVAGTAGYSTWLSALIALVPMMVAAFAFGELTAMLPGGGMISDYTLPTLGRFWATFALLSGYLVLIAADGGTQLVMGGLAMEELCGIPQLLVTVVLLAAVIFVNVFDVAFYGKVESVATIGMMIIFAGMAFFGNLRVGEAMGAAPVNAEAGMLPEGGWAAVFQCTGSAIWFFIGFEFACPMAEENKKPYRNIPWALILGLLSIYLIDSLFATAAVRYADMGQLASSAIPQMVAAKAMMGELGAFLMSCLTILASFTTANAYMASFPRMLYGLAREGLIPPVFGIIHEKTRTPIYGTLVTAGLISVTVIYITINGANVGVVQGLINTASITWMVSYAIAMIDVLVLRRKYPDYPRLWKAPMAWVTMPIGLIGVGYAIYTLRGSLGSALVCMALIAGFCLIWGIIKKVPMWKQVPIDVLARNIRDRSEYLPVWDEEVDAWCKTHSAG